MPRADTLVGRQSLVGRGVMLLRGRGIERGPFVDDGLQAADMVEIDIGAGHVEVEVVAVAEHFALAGIGEDDEFVRQIAADRAALRHHGDGA